MERNDLHQQKTYGCDQEIGVIAHNMSFELSLLELASAARRNRGSTLFGHRNDVGRAAQFIVRRAFRFVSVSDVSTLCLLGSCVKGA